MSVPARLSRARTWWLPEQGVPPGRGEWDAPSWDCRQGGRVSTFQLAIEAAPTGMLMVDRRGTIVLVNGQTERLFGYPREALVGQSVEILIPERFRRSHPGERAGFFASPTTRPMGAGRELYGLRADGTEIRVEIALNPLTTPEGDFVLGSVADITERMRTERERELLLERLTSVNAELTRSLKEREVLLQEVHHRVKNNLQVISSLINMQVRKLKGVGTETSALVECQTRVQVIAMIHEQLYRSKDYARVPFSIYVQALATSVVDALGASPARVTLELAIEDVTLAVDRAIPCGLILNELLTNALKHAFPDGREGTVHVGLERLGGRLRMTVRDDGVGLPERIDPERASSLGLELVRTLAEQLDAELEVTPRPSAAFRLTFDEASSGQGAAS